MFIDRESSPKLRTPLRVPWCNGRRFEFKSREMAVLFSRVGDADIALLKECLGFLVVRDL